MISTGANLADWSQGDTGIGRRIRPCHLIAAFLKPWLLRLAGTWTWEDVLNAAFREGADSRPLRIGADTVPHPLTSGAVPADPADRPGWDYAFEVQDGSRLLVIDCGNAYEVTLDSDGSPGRGTPSADRTTAIRPGAWQASPGQRHASA